MFIFKISLHIETVQIQLLKYLRFICSLRGYKDKVGRASQVSSASIAGGYLSSSYTEKGHPGGIASHRGGPINPSFYLGLTMILPCAPHCYNSYLLETHSWPVMAPHTGGLTPLGTHSKPPFRRFTKWKGSLETPSKYCQGSCI